MENFNFGELNNINLYLMNINENLKKKKKIPIYFIV